MVRTRRVYNSAIPSDRIEYRHNISRNWLIPKIYGKYGFRSVRISFAYLASLRGQD